MACPLSEPPSVNGVPAYPEIWVGVSLPVRENGVCENAGDATAKPATAAAVSARTRAVLGFKDVYPDIDATPSSVRMPIIGHSRGTDVRSDHVVFPIRPLGRST